ncbi:sugar kinase [Phaeovulum sp. W22_SRMD_FR3]|uniref:sugar kinase n=1 Tax=Phaeovulum sp. W22_SRMD_FR3 TaxID=3240274 RepID=UPI003F9B8099
MRFLSIGECMVELSGAGHGLWRSGFAGDTLNTAWYLRALAPDAWDIDYFTVLGRDPVSDDMCDFIAAAGIGTGNIARHPSRSPGLYMITLTEGERSFTYWRDSSAARTLADDAPRLQAACLAADAVYFSGITLGILTPEARGRLFAALEAARSAGRQVIFDPNLRPRLWPDADTMCMATLEAASHADIILPSHDDEATYFGDASPRETALRYLAAGAVEVVVKNGGSEMVLGRAGALPQVLPALPHVQPLDTTGAGDSFNGGYLAARFSGQDPEAAVLQGHRVAMEVVCHPGALMPAEKLRNALK